MENEDVASVSEVEIVEIAEIAQRDQRLPTSTETIDLVSSGQESSLDGNTSLSDVSLCRGCVEQRDPLRGEALDMRNLIPSRVSRCLSEMSTGSSSQLTFNVDELLGESLTFQESGRERLMNGSFLEKTESSRSPSPISYEDFPSKGATAPSALTTARHHQVALSPERREGNQESLVYRTTQTIFQREDIKPLSESIQSARSSAKAPPMTPVPPLSTFRNALDRNQEAIEEDKISESAPGPFFGDGFRQPSACSRADLVLECGGFCSLSGNCQVPKKRNKLGEFEYNLQTHGKKQVGRVIGFDRDCFPSVPSHPLFSEPASGHAIPDQCNGPSINSARDQTGFSQSCDSLDAFPRRSKVVFGRPCQDIVEGWQVYSRHSLLMWGAHKSDVCPVNGNSSEGCDSLISMDDKEVTVVEDLEFVQFSCLVRNGGDALFCNYENALLPYSGHVYPIRLFRRSRDTNGLEGFRYDGLYHVAVIHDDEGRPVTKPSSKSSRYTFLLKRNPAGVLIDQNKVTLEQLWTYVKGSPEPNTL